MTERSTALRFAFALLALLPALAFAQANPRLASLTIEIWPEYDRPATLIIVRGVVADDVKLPAAMTLRLPAASEGAAAVAYSATADGNLLNLPHEQAKSGDYVTVKFQLPERFFHVEFYTPIATGDAARTFRYTWPGDFAVGRATLIVQEPATAQGLVTEPELKELSSGAAGLNYRSGDLGALAAGKAVPITIKYTKSDARPTADIKGLRTAQAAPSSAPSPAAPVAAGSDLPPWVLPMAAFVALGLVSALFVVLMWRRQKSPGSSAYCRKCGAPLRPGDKFCGKCGTKTAA